MKEFFSFQKLKISFCEILFQRKPPHASSVLLFQLRHKEELICKNEKRVLQKSIYDEVINTQKQSFRYSSKWVSFRISQISQQENTCVGVFYSNVAGLKACNFAKKRLQHRCFPVKFSKLLRTPLVAAYEF